MRIHVKPPSFVLYEFDGHIEYVSPDGAVDPKSISIDSKNLLLKGAKLKNTKWILGIVAYTGTETKIQMNATTAKSKMTQMEKKLHKVIIAIFLFQLIISIFTVFGRSLMLVTHDKFTMNNFLSFVGNSKREIRDYDSVLNNLADGFRYFLLLGTMIPISLIVTLEIVRLFQSVLMSQNYELFSPAKEIHCKVNTSTVNEELGQIEYILSDKTGTLTQNKMVLQGIYLGDQVFGGHFVRKPGALEYEAYKEKNKKSKNLILNELADKFDPNLYNVIHSKEKARLRRPLVLASSAIEHEKVVLPPNTRKLEEGIMIVPKKDSRNTLPPLKLAAHNSSNSSEKSKSVMDNLDDKAEFSPIKLGKKKTFEISPDTRMSDSRIGLMDDTPIEFKPEDSPKLPFLSMTPNHFKKNPNHEIKKLEDTAEKPMNTQFSNHMRVKSEASIHPSPSQLSFTVPENASVFSQNSNRTGNTSDVPLKKVSLFSKKVKEVPLEAPSQITVNTYQELISEFLQCASLCHSCVVEIDFERHATYQGPSPDEIAICKSMAEIGCRYMGRDSQGQARIEQFKEEKRFEVMLEFAFDSTRKRQSVIVKDSQGVYKLYIKGADNTMIPLINKSIEHPFLERYQGALDDFSFVGLRTLVFGCRLLTEKQFEEIYEEYQDAYTSLDKREKMLKLCDKVEQNISLLGISAIKDHLQEKVSESITKFREANIKVWMITGDKLQTAESIAFSAGLFCSNTRVFTFSESTLEQFPKHVVHLKRRMQRVRNGTQKGIVVDVSQMNFVFSSSKRDLSKDLRDSIKLFTDLLMEADAVVCSRATPKQKAKIVNLVMSKGKTVLAVGDGANDVNMLTCANVGVGIYGEEGIQAVQASDYAIPNFRYLWKLVLVHGRWSNIRIGMFLNYFLFKNFVLALPQFIYGFFNLFSGNPIYDGNLSNAYNMFMTSAVIIYVGLYEKDISYEKILSKEEEEKEYENKIYTGYTDDNSYLPTSSLKYRPLIKKHFHRLYYTTQQGWSFGWRTFFFEALNAIVMSLLIIFIGYGVFSGIEIVHSNGHTADFWMASFSIYAALVYFVNLVLIIRVNQITWSIIFCVVVFALAPFFILTFLFDTVMGGVNAGQRILFNLAEVYHYYLLFILFLMVVFLIEFNKKMYSYYYNPQLPQYFKWLIMKGYDNDPEYFKPEIIDSFIKTDPVPYKKKSVPPSELERPSQELQDNSNNSKERKMSESEVSGQSEDNKKSRQQGSTVVGTSGPVSFTGSQTSLPSLIDKNRFNSNNSSLGEELVEPNQGHTPCLREASNFLSNNSQVSITPVKIVQRKTKNKKKS